MALPHQILVSEIRREHQGGKPMEKNELNMEKNTPEKSFRASPISATIWTNELETKDGESRMFRTITLERTYKDKDGNWKKTHSLRVNDLPKATLVLNKCYEYISIKEEEQNIIEE
jgi:hypothetical protein